MPERPIVVGLGEVLWDCYPDARRLGGAPANVAYHSGQLGCHAVLVSRVGRDHDGDELSEQLAARGLDLAFLQRDPDRPTGRVTVQADDPARPSFVIHEDAAWDRIMWDEELGGLMERAAAVCFGTLAQRSPESRETIHRCLERAQNALVVYDVNLRQDWFTRDRIEASLGLADVVKLNQSELERLAGLLHAPSTEPAGFGAHLRERHGVGMTCVTRAERGCVLATPEATLAVPGEPVAVVDAVGAGDAFTAALVTGLLRGWPPGRAGAFANAMGALVACHSGAMPDVREEAAALMARFGRS